MLQRPIPAIVESLEARVLLSAAPVFDAESYDFEIDEDAETGDVVGSVSATDADEQSVEYSIDDGAGGSVPFAIDENGQITVAGPLDFETQAVYTLQATATDPDDNVTTVEVEVSLDDVDEPPVFDAESFGFNVNEHTPIGTVVGTVGVSDPEGESLTLTIDDGAGGTVPFAIDENGQITVNGPLDFESDSFYVLEVTATDPDDNTSAVVVEVTIDNVDGEPVFDQNSYTFDVDEDAAVGSLVGSVSATDPDEQDVTYAIVDESDVPFEIDSNGQISVTGPLDFETDPLYTLHVTATDVDGHVTTVEVTIEINDVDEDPVFSEEKYRFIIDEDLAVGEDVGDVSATDPQGQDVDYEIDDGFGQPVPFAIDENGRITVAGELDYSSRDFYLMQVIAVDSDGNESKVLVEVWDSDNPDNTAPVARDSWTSTLYDQPVEGSVASQVDDANGDPLEFFLETGPEHGDLTFNSDGTFTYTPDDGFTTAVDGDSFTWYASDGFADGNVAVVNLNVFNNPPKVFDNWLSSGVDEQLTGDVSSQTYDEDDDALTFLEEEGPSNGALTFNSDGTFAYTPDDGFTGLDSFTWYATDGVAESNRATVFLNVEADADELTANDDVDLTLRDEPVTISVLDNDGSPDGGLTVVDAGQGTHGTVTFDGTSVTYTPTDPDFFGHDTFEYEIEDSTGATATATVHVFVLWIDLDVNDDGDLVDAVDGAEDYDPGFVGVNDVLSSDGRYNGQEMRVIVEGIGSDSGLQQVLFELVDVSTQPGFSDDDTYPLVEGAGKDHDFSFAPDQNRRMMILTPDLDPDEGAQMEEDRAWVNLSAKDYRGEVEVRITIPIGSDGDIRVFTLTLD